ncbi:MAG: radical SAM protein [Candidatus Omnitrophica bacterium]|nr:radical SAM protein [Candidatus Omnitrophota bacterium]
MPNLMFEITQKCNQDCKFCYNVWKENELYPKNELALSKIKSLFLKLTKEIPLKQIAISGGEPLLRTDLVEVVVFFNSLGISVSLATNGLFLNEKLIEKLILAGVKNFDLTLLSSSAKEHNELSGNENSFETVCKSIPTIIKYKSSVSVSFVCLRQNAHRACGVYDIAFGLGARHLTFLPFTPTGKGLINNDRLRLSKDMLKSALYKLDSKVGTYLMPVNLGICVDPCLFKIPFKNIKFSFCGGGLHKFTIDSMGNLRPCEQSSKILGNLFEDSFNRLEKSDKIKKFRKVRYKKCYICGYMFKCIGGCRFSSVFN